MSHHHRGPATASAAQNEINTWWNDFQRPITAQENTPGFQPSQGNQQLDDHDRSIMRTVLDHDITQSYQDAVVALQSLPAQDSGETLSQAPSLSGLDYTPYQTSKPNGDPLPKGFQLDQQSRDFYGQLQGTKAEYHNLQTNGTAFGNWHQDEAFLADITNAQNFDHHDPQSYDNIFNTNQKLVDQADAKNAGHYEVNSDLKSIEEVGQQQAAAYGGSSMARLDGEIAQTETILTGSPDGHGKGGYLADWGEDAHSLGTGPFDNPANFSYEDPRDDQDLSTQHLNKTTLLNDIVRADALPDDEYGSSQGNDTWYTGHSWKDYYENYNYNGILDDNDPTAAGSKPNQTVTGEPYLSEINGASSTFPDPHTYLPEEVKETDHLMGLPQNKDGQYGRFYGDEQIENAPTGQDQLSLDNQESAQDDYATYRHDLDDHASASTLKGDLQHLDRAEQAHGAMEGRDGKIFKNLALVDADFHSMEDLKTHGNNGRVLPTTTEGRSVNWNDGEPTQHYQIHKASPHAILPDLDENGPGSPDLNHQAASETVNVDGTPQDISGDRVGQPEHTQLGDINSISDLKGILTNEKEEFKGLSNLASSLKAQKELATHDMSGQYDPGHSVLPQSDVMTSGDKIGKDLDSAAAHYGKKSTGDQTHLQDQENAQQILTVRRNLGMDQSGLNSEWNNYHEETGDLYEGNIIRCFAAGSLIETQDGPCRVEDLRPGVQVMTQKGYQPVKEILSSALLVSKTIPKAHFPICIEKGALGNGLPSQDLVVSGGHGLYFTLGSQETSEEFLIPARLLVNSATIRRLPVRAMRYYHVRLPSHALLKSHGVWSESYYPATVQAPHYLFRMVQKLRSLLGLSCAQKGEILPRFRSGYRVRAVKRRLARSKSCASRASSQRRSA